ncbi:MAG: precorrin-2 C(20)-methyltransferase [Leptolyngbyaceae cyanobacterium bins.59]|nr:precorrin-2 C(20)-methyltransferase [Leptolyngbyaceae cyanobacterium bins.59]
MPQGTLYGIGVGPGDAELITLKGWRILQQVPIVAFPSGLGGKLGIAEQIAGHGFQAHQKQVPLDFPYVQDEQVLQQAWEQAAEEVWPFLQEGQDVAFLSEGDISFYSTFTYLAQTIQTFHPEARIQAVPGICSPLAAVAQLGIPLTIRDQRLVILPALYQVEELKTVLAWADVVVLMKVKSVYSQVWQILAEHGLLDRSYVVERATFPDQKIYAGIRDESNLSLSYFSLLIVKVQA